MSDLPLRDVLAGLFALLLCATFGGANSAHGQGNPPPTGSSLEDLDRRARVYLDCQFCDESYIRRNLTFVDYVRDRKQSDVHVLITTQRSGSGGISFRLRFIGRGPFEDTTFDLTYESPPTDTDDDRRRGLVQQIRLGLGPFASRTPVGSQISLSYEADSTQEGGSTPEEDPWNRWVFEVGASGRVSVEEQSQGYDFRGDLEASRVTRAWKLELEAETDYELDVFEPEGRAETRSSSRDNSFSGEAIKSLGPHWGAGVFQRTFSRTSTNKDLAVRGEAALEYNFFPYRVSDRKSLTVTYRVGPEYNDYDVVTIYGKRTQSLAQQSLEVSLDLEQPWGSIFSSLRGSHYFNDLTRNRLQFNNFLQLQLVEGLSLRLSARVELIQDQLFLPAGDLPQEEILLRRQELATNYQLRGSIGLSYTFGSIYNNVVNPRL